MRYEQARVRYDPAARCHHKEMRRAAAIRCCYAKHEGARALMRAARAVRGKRRTPQTWRKTTFEYVQHHERRAHPRALRADVHPYHRVVTCLLMSRRHDIMNKTSPHPMIFAPSARASQYFARR